MTNSNNSIPAADLFAGLGGFSEGARQTGRVDVQFAANHWPDAVAIHSLNHPSTHHECQDLMHVDWRLLPDLSSGILLASPACQGHSNAGQPAQKGTGGSHKPDPTKLLSKHQADRNTAWAVLAACDTARPRSVVVENVVSFQRWELFEAWTSMLGAMGYHVRTHTLNSKDYGSAQDRSRTIITASLDRAVELAPRLDGQGLTIADVLDPDDHASNRWTAIDSKSVRMIPRIRKAQNEGGSRCLWNNVSESRGRPLDDKLPTLTTQSGTQLCLVDGDRIRVLNPRELARAQGFPETYQLPSNRRLASKLIGNAIDVNLARGIVQQVAAGAAK